MTKRETYLPGVPCWVDVVQDDVDATTAFYGGLLGWTFEPRTPPGAPQRYLYAYLDGEIVGGVGGPPLDATERQGWTTYVRVESADAAAEAVVKFGGEVLLPPTDVGPPGHSTGRSVVFADPAGATIGGWEAATLQGSEVVNVPGSWNFSDLHVADVERVKGFYAAVFGWELDVLDMGQGRTSGMWRRPGYGDFLMIDDPGLEERQATAPPGFMDAVALLAYTDGAGTGDRAQWSIVFSVADAKAALARAFELGATELEPFSETAYTAMATVRDPQGAVVTLSQYKPSA
jgi:predicted enzyme related to lactoylglutathione lyase